MLLSEKELSLDKAFSLAQSAEFAEQRKRILTTYSDTDLPKINNFNAGPSNKHDDKSAHKCKPCYHCCGKHSPHHY